MGKDDAEYVVITDGSKEMNIIFYTTDGIPLGQ